MGSAMTLGLVMGGMNAASSLMGSEAQARAQSAQAKGQQAAMNAQAKNLESQARLEEDRGRIEAGEIDRRKSKMRRDFEDTQAKNRSLLAAGNVDMASGSAADVAEGNISLFAQDLSDNAYQKALKEWETKTSAANLKTQAANARASADWYGEQASQASPLPSLLSAAITGAGSFASGYSMAGGKLGSLFGSSPPSVPVSQLTTPTSGGAIWGHPSGKLAFVPGVIRK